MDAVRAAVRAGKVREGERLPSIRALASDLAINPNTVARANRELEWLGVVTSRLGSGFEVRRGESRPGEVRRKLREAVGEALIEADLLEDASSWRNGASVEAEAFFVPARALGSSLEPVAKTALRQEGPGRYAGRFRPRGPGVYLVRARSEGEMV